MVIVRVSIAAILTTLWLAAGLNTAIWQQQHRVSTWYRSTLFNYLPMGILFMLLGVPGMLIWPPASKWLKRRTNQ